MPKPTCKEYLYFTMPSPTQETLIFESASPTIYGKHTRQQPSLHITPLIYYLNNMHYHTTMTDASPPTTQNDNNAPKAHPSITLLTMNIAPPPNKYQHKQDTKSISTKKLKMMALCLPNPCILDILCSSTNRLCHRPWLSVFA